MKLTEMANLGCQHKCHLQRTKLIGMSNERWYYQWTEKCICSRHA